MQTMIIGGHRVAAQDGPSLAVEVTLLREPLGVTAHITPWNHPTQMPGRALAPGRAQCRDCALGYPGPPAFCAWIERLPGSHAGALASFSNAHPFHDDDV